MDNIPEMSAQTKQHWQDFEENRTMQLGKLSPSTKADVRKSFGDISFHDKSHTLRLMRCRCIFDQIENIFLFTL